MASSSVLLLALLLTTSLTTHVIGSRILMVPYQWNSHVHSYITAGEDLKRNGHDVYILMSPTYPKLQGVRDGPLKVITHRPAEVDFLTSPKEEFTMDIIEHLSKTSVIDVTRNLPPGRTDVSEAAAMDDELLERLQAMNFDLVLFDNYPLTWAYIVLAHKMRVPYVAMQVGFEPWNMKNPSLPSFVPFNYLRHSDKMNFWERFDNFWRQVDWVSRPGAEYKGDHLLRKLLPNEPETTFNSLFSNVMLWFIETDFSLDYARPTMPNEVLIGGLTTKPARPLLDEELDEFVAAAEHGVIVVSFGSIGDSFPASINEKLLEAFSGMQQRVVWRYLGNFPDHVNSNVKLVSWLPQNDLLGHNNTRLFVTHCGLNGQFEALYHGVPMVNFPLFAEQHYNARRSASKGYSLTLSIVNFTAKQVRDTMQEVLEDSKFRERIRHGSAVFRGSIQTPQQRMTSAINHVLSHGADHLHSHALDMPWYELLMLDILLFLVFIVFVSIAVVIFSIKISLLWMRHEEKHIKYN